MSYILEVKDLTKQYPGVLAVDHISFAIPQGICFGLLGPNGAGKTTTIEMIEGITKPTAGNILFAGKQRNNNFKQRIGIQFQATALMDYLTTQEILKLFANFYRHTLPLATVIELCNLSDILNRYATKLSGGQRQRLLLALSILNDPDLIFLDEPTTGLDPKARRQFWQLIEKIKQQGKTVLLTTHYMDEAEALCDELIIIDQGNIIEQGTPATLLQKHFSSVHISIPRDNITTALPLKSFAKAQISNDKIVFTTNEVTKLISQLLAENINLAGLSIRRHNLEDLFLKLTGHHLQDAKS
ncbi:ABC transporter ATP-binding protein [Endozoicomonas sp. SM1973]|uniref:ABC transporter ATP-binding protein n=1 Tax=Spartinivicinus marinus TaxID=2994442 RepID=A0A853I763_9GAMM|nr:ABC transporter ATP-binding protein [Spartinivicinus marinus]MCX4028362.1 ABC transporter ATP-binding protein [Spartinivicinus marinus]NYZ68639.1 ABC transporter ATP-binding protein [Spartinivicinus marinus]